MTMHDDLYIPIYRILKSARLKDEEKLLRIFSWTEDNISTIKRSTFKNTFKQANREDLLEVFVQEDEVGINDVIRSRYTNRVGEVLGLKGDGETLVVKWDTGQLQNVAKTSVIKLTGMNGSSPDKPIESLKDYQNLKSKSEPYDAQEDKVIDTERPVELKTREVL